MSWIPYLTMFLLAAFGLMLIFIILLQRGRGGGLAGALGGMGGQSAFGTKAGDVFTKITVVLAIIWVVLAAGNVYALRGFGGPKFKGGTNAVKTAPALEGKDGDKQPDDELNLPASGDAKSGDAKPGDTAPAESGAVKPDPATESKDTPKVETPAAEAEAKPDAAATPAEKSEKTPE
jgi:preprotein translocase subunit SecG